MIFQPDLGGGHHVTHVRSIAKEALRRGWKVSLATSREATESLAFKGLVQDCGSTLQAIIVTGAPRRFSKTMLGLLVHQYRYFRFLYRAYRATLSIARPDFVYLINLDPCDKVMPWLGSPFRQTPFGGVVMTVRFHHRDMGVLRARSRQNRLYGFFFRRLLAVRPLQFVATIDELLPVYCEKRHIARARKVRYLPDIGALNCSSTMSEARRALSIPGGNIVILVYGQLRQNKGIDELLKAVYDPMCDQSIIVLLAGTVTCDVEHTLATAPATALRATGRLRYVGGFLDDRCEADVFSASDMVWVGYRGHHGMSGVMVQAAVLGIPVIACTEGLIGYFARLHRIGEVVEVSVHRDIVAALNRLAADPQLRASYGQRKDEFKAKHSTAAFGRSVCDLIAEQQ